jgi:hypothetical protein
MVVVGPPGASADHATFAKALCAVLRALLERCRTTSFNVAVYVPPAAAAAARAYTPRGWLAPCNVACRLQQPAGSRPSCWHRLPPRHAPCTVGRTASSSP